MADNDRTLFEALHRDYHPMVLQMCLGFMKGDEELAKDLSQEVFINTWNALNKFKGASSYKTWIYRISANTCLKYIRDTKDKNRLPLNEVEQYPSESPVEAQDSINHKLYHAIGTLGEVDRLIIMMVLDELEYDEIAGVVGIREGSLRVKIHRIKKQLKKILDNER